MKNKIKLISLAVGALAMSSCGFDIIFSMVKEIKIEDYHNAYQKDEKFSDKNELKITAYYSSGKIEELKYSDVSINLSNGSKSVNPSQAFGSEGTYELTVTYNKKTSNSLSLTVNKDYVYATSVSLSLASNFVDVNDSISGEFVIKPANYNVDVKFNSDNKVKTSKTGKSSISIEGLQEGDSSVTVSVPNSGSTSISDTKYITVRSISKTSLSQSYSDYVKKCWYTVSACPSVGEAKLLVIPLWFTDSSNYFNASYKENVRSDIRTAYFGSTSETGWHSVSSYYEEESGGRLVLSGTVSSWYNVGSSVSAYATDDNHGTKTGELIAAATDWYFENNPSDSRTNYDYDGDGFLDGVIGIYAAPDKQSLKDTTTYANLWAYCSNTDKHADVSYPVTKAYFWASYDFMYGNTKALERTGASYYHGDTSHSNIDTHTYIHEMGHVLGLEDYYDTSYQYNPAGGFSMQDANVGGHDPFSSMALGWSDPYIPNRSVKLKIYSFQESHDVILLTPNWNDVDSPFDEYLALELYTPTGLNELDTRYRYFSNYPQGVNDIGVRLWHVDARLTSRDAKTSWSTDLTSDIKSVPSGKKILTAFSNSSLNDDDPRSSILGGHISPLVTYANTSSYVYAKYDLLHLVRNNKSAPYYGSKDDNFSTSHLFKQGSSFSMSDYKSQFVNSGKLNSGIDLNWSFSIEEIGKDVNGTYAFIQLNYLVK